MENIKNIIKDYKYDLFTVSILLIIFTILAFIFVGHQGNPIIDGFPNAYLSSEILKGKILYKDLFIVYGPLSYQFNALLFLIFGEHLNTLYTAGIINSLIILTAVYLIARSITSRLVAFAVTFATMTICIFDHFIFNYIFPYASAMTYALSAFLISFLFCIYYIKYSAPKFLGLSIFFIFISLSSKIDFFLFLILLITIALFLKPVPKKFLFKSLVISLIIPLISWIILFAQGLRISDLATYYYYFNKFLNSPIIKYFYGFTLDLEYNKVIFSYYISMFKQFSLIFIPSAAVIYFLTLLISNKFSNIIRFNFSKTLQIIASSALFIGYSGIIILNRDIRNDITGNIFCWIAVTTLLILIFTIIQLFRKNKIYFKDKIFILILIIGIFTSLRSRLFINLQSFGTYFLPLLLLGNSIFLIDYIPNYFKFIDRKTWKKTCSIILISLSLVFCTKYALIAKLENKYPISTNKGTFYTLKTYQYPINQAIDYINKEMPKDASFMMFPQGPILNFLTNRSSHGWYYDLMPVIILTFDEDKILNCLIKNPPDYIFINNRDSSDWGFSYFGKDYGTKLNYFIEQNYKLEKVSGNKFWIKIYKKNSRKATQNGKY